MSDETAESVTRRRAMKLLGAGGVVAATGVVASPPAHAGHDATNLLHLGEFNTAPAGSMSGTTLLVSNAASRVLDVRNTTAGGQDTGGFQAWSRGAGPAIQGNATADLEFPPQGAGNGVQGHSGSGAGVFGTSASGSGVEGHTETGVAGRFAAAGDGLALEVLGPVHAVGRSRFDDQPNDFVGPQNPVLHVVNTGEGSAVAAVAFGTAGVFGVRSVNDDDDSPALVGTSLTEDGQGLGGAHTGVFGESGLGIGVEGRCGGGTGVFGHSGVGPAVHGECLRGTGVLGEHTDTEVPGDGVRGQSAFGRGVVGHSVTDAGVRGTSDTAIGVTGIGDPGVQGGSVSGHGVHGQSESVDHAGVFGEGRVCVERGPCDPLEGGIGVLGRSDSGQAVVGEAGTGIGVHAISASGPALQVDGKAKFSTQGSATVPAGQLSVLVANSAVTSASHISITLVTDPGDRSVRWVERLAGGFRLHLTQTQPKNRPATGFTYLITEPV